MIPLRGAVWAAVAVSVIAGSLLLVNSLKEAGRNEIRPALDAALAERDNILATLENERAARRKAEGAVSAYSKELQSIRRRYNSEPVRVCFDETAPVPATGSTAGSADAATAAAGSIPAAPRGDLAALRELAYQCDALSAQLRALQGWAR